MEVAESCVTASELFTRPVDRLRTMQELRALGQTEQSLESIFLELTEK